MPSNFAMSLMSTLEFLLWAVLGFTFWKKGLHSRFPAMSTYLGLRLASMPVLLGLFYILQQPSSNQEFFYPIYFYTSWAVYIASAVTLFFICQEVFRTALSSFAGLMRLGTIVFRWTTLVSLIVSLSSVSFNHRGVLLIPDIAFALMRSVSILELCLLAFLCLCMNALGISARDVTFGIALGFGLLSTNDFILASFWSRNTSLTSPIQFFNEALILATLGIWVVYCALPEPARKPVVLAANSTIYRWNEIAAALGHGTKVAVPQPANSFFLTDVEKVVDKVLTRTNMQGSESKS
jgi:hypothetical protein